MLEALMNAIDTDEIVAKIKECQILTDKVAMWQTLKEMAFGKIICCLSIPINFRQKTSFS
jgi:hypothetical protein